MLIKKDKKSHPHRKNRLSKLNNKIAILITTAMGSMGAVYFFSIGILLWIGWESFSPDPSDPYPFTFLLLILNVAQMLLMPLIMVGQNLLGKYSELHAEKAYQTTILNYKDLQKILVRLDQQDTELLRQTQMLENLLRSHIKNTTQKEK